MKSDEEINGRDNFLSINCPIIKKTTGFHEEAPKLPDKFSDV